MRNHKNKKHVKHPNRWVFILSYVFIGIVIGVFICWFIFLKSQVRPVNMNCVSYLVCEDNVTGAISVDSVVDYMERLDSMESEVVHIQSDFQKEVDLMIDKANGWLAFWIGILTLVIGIMSIWQIFRQNRNDKDFRELKHETARNLKNEFDKYKNNSDNQLKKLEDKIAEYQHALCETKLSSFMICLGGIPDPQMTDNSAEKKRQIRVFVDHIYTTFHEYVNWICKQNEGNTLDEENVFLVLTVLKLAIVRIHGIYSDIHQNIRIQHLLDEISNFNNNILDKRASGTLKNKVEEIDLKLHELVQVL